MIGRAALQRITDVRAMPYTMNWYLPERIVHSVGTGVMVLADVRGFLDDGYAMIDQGKPLVHLIVDISSVGKVESIPQSLRMVRGSTIHPNMGWVIFVGRMNPVVTLLANLAGAIIQSRYRRCDTLDDALEFLKERDASLAGMETPSRP
jgi:hypothetical protein